MKTISLFLLLLCASPAAASEIQYSGVGGFYFHFYSPETGDRPVYFNSESASATFDPDTGELHFSGYFPIITPTPDTNYPAWMVNPVSITAEAWYSPASLSVEHTTVPYLLTVTTSEFSVQAVTTDFYTLTHFLPTLDHFAAQWLHGFRLPGATDNSRILEVAGGIYFVTPEPATGLLALVGLPLLRRRLKKS